MSKERDLHINLVIKNNDLLGGILDKYDKEERSSLISELFYYTTMNSGEERETILTNFLRTISEYSDNLFHTILKEDPYLIKYVDEQTPELCDSVVGYLYCGDKLNISHMFGFIKHQTKNNVSLAVSGDSRCYKYVNKELRSYDLALKAIKEDARVLKHIDPEYQTEELLTTAINSWAKAVLWINCGDNELRDKMILLAMTKNLQSIPSPDKIDLTPQLKEKFKTLCLVSGYFPTDWINEFNFSQDELYSILVKKKDCRYSRYFKSK